MLRADMRRDGLCMCGHVLDSSHDHDCRHCVRLSAHVTTCLLGSVGGFGGCSTCAQWSEREQRRQKHASDFPVDDCRCRHCNANRLRGVKPMPFEPDDKE